MIFFKALIKVQLCFWYSERLKWGGRRWSGASPGRDERWGGLTNGPQMEPVRASLNIYGAPLSTLQSDGSVFDMQIGEQWLRWLDPLVRWSELELPYTETQGICYKIVFYLLWNPQDLLNPLSKFEEYIGVMISCWEYLCKKKFHLLICKVSSTAKFKSDAVNCHMSSPGSTCCYYCPTFALSMHIYMVYGM